MPRFYFHLTSMDRHISDDHGKELGTLNDAYSHALKLIDKILLYVGPDNVRAWKVVITSDKHEIIVPFPVSYSGFSLRREPSNSTTGGPVSARDIVLAGGRLRSESHPPRGDFFERSDRWTEDMEHGEGNLLT